MIEHNCVARPVFPHDSRTEMDSLAKALAAMAARVDALERELVLVKKRLKGPSIFGPHSDRPKRARPRRPHHQGEMSGESALKSNFLP